MGNFLHYLRYVTMSSADKTDWLLTLAQHDPFYRNIVSKLESYGYEIKHQWFGSIGAYVPATITIESSSNIEAYIVQQHADGDIKAHFLFSSRFGSAQIAHTFLHELMHFWQDYHGLFLTPLIEKVKAPIMLDAASHVAVTCFCEAMAETESLRASWRLKEAGHPTAWQGAITSFDWRSHATSYAADIERMPEVESARRAFDRWYGSHQRAYYEKHAWNRYQQIIKDSHLTDSASLRSVDLDQLIQTLPLSEQPDYLLLPEKPSLNDVHYRTIQHQPTAASIGLFEEQYGNCTNPNFLEIQSGSLPYIWQSSRHPSQVA